MPRIDFSPQLIFATNWEIRLLNWQNDLWRQAQLQQIEKNFENLLRKISRFCEGQATFKGDGRPCNGDGRACNGDDDDDVMPVIVLARAMMTRWCRRWWRWSRWYRWWWRLWWLWWLWGWWWFNRSRRATSSLTGIELVVCYFHDGHHEWNYLDI